MTDASAELEERVYALGRTISCPICLSLMERPARLPCLHYFCWSCITHDVRPRGEVMCPICRGRSNRREIQLDEKMATISQLYGQMESALGKPLLLTQLPSLEELPQEKPHAVGITAAPAAAKAVEPPQSGARRGVVAADAIAEGKAAKAPVAPSRAEARLSGGGKGRRTSARRGSQSLVAPATCAPATSVAAAPSKDVEVAAVAASNSGEGGRVLPLGGSGEVAETERQQQQKEEEEAKVSSAVLREVFLNTSNGMVKRRGRGCGPGGDGRRGGVAEKRRRLGLVKAGGGDSGAAADTLGTAGQEVNGAPTTVVAEAAAFTPKAAAGSTGWDAVATAGDESVRVAAGMKSSAAPPPPRLFSFLDPTGEDKSPVSHSTALTATVTAGGGGDCDYKPSVHGGGSRSAGARTEGQTGDDPPAIDRWQMVVMSGDSPDPPDRQQQSQRQGVQQQRSSAGIREESDGKELSGQRHEGPAVAAAAGTAGSDPQVRPAAGDTEVGETHPVDALPGRAVLSPDKSGGQNTRTATTGNGALLTSVGTAAVAAEAAGDARLTPTKGELLPVLRGSCVVPPGAGAAGGVAVIAAVTTAGTATAVVAASGDDNGGGGGGGGGEGGVAPSSRRVPSRLLPWRCLDCTFDNKAASKRCTMCCAVKPGPPRNNDMRDEAELSLAAGNVGVGAKERPTEKKATGRRGSVQGRRSCAAEVGAEALAAVATVVGADRAKIRRASAPAAAAAATTATALAAGETDAAIAASVTVAGGAVHLEEAGDVAGSGSGVRLVTETKSATAKKSIRRGSRVGIPTRRSAPNENLLTAAALVTGTRLHTPVAAAAAPAVVRSDATDSATRRHAASGGGGGSSRKKPRLSPLVMGTGTGTGSGAGGEGYLSPAYSAMRGGGVGGEGAAVVGSGGRDDGGRWSQLCPGWVLLGSALEDGPAGKGLLKRLAAAAGCRVVEQFNSSVTHVLCGTDSSRRARRTFKYLMGVAHGCWILDVSWAAACVSVGRAVPEDGEFAVLGDQNGGVCGAGEARRRQLRHQQQRQLPTNAVDASPAGLDVRGEVVSPQGEVGQKEEAEMQVAEGDVVKERCGWQLLDGVRVHITGGGAVRDDVTALARALGATLLPRLPLSQLSPTVAAVDAAVDTVTAADGGNVTSKTPAAAAAAATPCRLLSDEVPTEQQQLAGGREREVGGTAVGGVAQDLEVAMLPHPLLLVDPELAAASSGAAARLLSAVAATATALGVPLVSYKWLMACAGSYSLEPWIAYKVER